MKPRLVMGILAALGLSFSAPAEDFLISHTAQLPQVEVRAISGEEIDLGATGAEVTVVHLFACESAICGESVPAIEEHVWRPLRDRGVLVIGIGRDATAEDLERLASDKGITFPLVADPDRKLTSLFSEEGKGVPRTIVTTSKGVVAYRHAGYVSGRDAEFRRVAEDLLAGYVPSEFPTCGSPVWVSSQAGSVGPMGEQGTWVGKNLPEGTLVQEWINEPSGDGAGKFRLVEFWATWCGPCIMVMPSIQEKHEKYGSRVAIISISDEDPATVQQFVKEKGWTYPIGVDQRGTMKNLIGVRGIPHGLLVDPQGVIVWEGHPGEFMGADGQKRFEKLIGWSQE